MPGNANSGRRRKPDALRDLHGSTTRPHHRSRPEPKYAVEAPKPPKSLSAAARAEWNRIVPELVKQRLVAVVDLAVLASYCTLYGMTEQIRIQMRKKGFELVVPEPVGENGIKLREHPLVKLQRQVTAQMRGYLVELGFTPASRARVSPAPTGQTPQPDSPAPKSGLEAIEAQLSGRRMVGIDGGKK